MTDHGQGMRLPSIGCLRPDSASAMAERRCLGIACVRSSTAMAWGQRRQGSNGKGAAALAPALPSRTETAINPDPISALFDGILQDTRNFVVACLIRGPVNILRRLCRSARVFSWRRGQEPILQ